MNKDELQELFKDHLNDLTDFENNIKRVKDLIYLIIENFDLLKDDATDEQICDISSEINIKASKINSLIQDILSDSKKLESFINEIKLLKRKRDKKLGKDKNKEDNSKLKSLEELLKKLNSGEIDKEKINPKITTFPNKPIKHPYIPNPNKWDIQF